MFKPFMKYHGNNICPNERTNERTFQRDNLKIIPSPTLYDSEGIKIVQNIINVVLNKIKYIKFKNKIQ